MKNGMHSSEIALVIEKDVPCPRKFARLGNSPTTLKGRFIKDIAPKMVKGDSVFIPRTYFAIRDWVKTLSKVYKYKSFHCRKEQNGSSAGTRLWRTK